MSTLFDKNWEITWTELCTGLRSFVQNAGFSDIVLGLSGGMDSTLTAALAVDALGAEHVHGVLMPSPWSSEGSITDAVALAGNLGISTVTLPIAPAMQAFEQILTPAFQGLPADVTEENIQSRIRGVLLMALSNKFKWMLLATGNKSELAAGYCTMYGDTCGALAPIADLYKTEVYRLAAWYNTSKGQEIIPLSVFEKAPSAELRPGQKDQDSLPDYLALDSVLHALIEEERKPETLTEFDSALVTRVLQLIHGSAFKRKQCCPLLAVGKHAFGIQVHM